MDILPFDMRCAFLEIDMNLFLETGQADVGVGAANIEETEDDLRTILIGRHTDLLLGQDLQVFIQQGLGDLSRRGGGQRDLDLVVFVQLGFDHILGRVDEFLEVGKAVVAFAKGRVETEHGVLQLGRQHPFALP